MFCAKGVEEMQKMLDDVGAAATAIGLVFKPEKSMTLTVKNGKIENKTYKLQNKNLSPTKKIKVTITFVVLNH